MSNFWNEIPDVYNEQHEKTIIGQIVNARNIVFVAKGRVGLVTKMFMQRLIQYGYNCYWHDDLHVPKLNNQDLIIFVSASGQTLSSWIYTQVAKDINARTMAITFNDTGRITRAVKVPVIYNEKRNNMPMKSYYELAFMYIFEKLLSTFDTGKFTHTNFE